MLRKTLNVTAEQPSECVASKEHRCVAVIVNPLINYHVTGKVSTITIQAVSVRVESTPCTVIYVSPGAKSEDMTRELHNIAKISGDGGIIMGDINARDKQRDQKGHARGKVSKRWAMENG